MNLLMESKSIEDIVQDSGRKILIAQDLRKSYGARLALDGLSFSLNAGRILGFLGPNGAGKTTSIRILTTILEPDGGRFIVDDTGSEYPDQIRHKIGVLPESLGFPKNITGIEYLIFFGQLYGRTAAEAKAKGLVLLDEVGLQQRANSLLGTYSHGMRQRLGIARALVNDPVVVFLDEPTLGLDPRGQHELLGLVKQIARDRSAGVILCSHILAEVESVCDDVVILNSGRIVASGTVSEVIWKSAHNHIRINTARSSLEEARHILELLDNVVKVTPEGEISGWLRVELLESTEEASSHDSLVYNHILGALIHAGVPILGFEPEGSRLQDVFLHLTEEALT